MTYLVYRPGEEQVTTMTKHLPYLTVLKYQELEQHSFLHRDITKCSKGQKQLPFFGMLIRKSNSIPLVHNSNKGPPSCSV